MKTAAEIEAMLRRLADLERTLYENEPCGGPLHIITDDGNVRDEDLVSCFRWLHENPPESATTALVSLEILKLLALMTWPQREVWWVKAGWVDPKTIAETLARVRDGRVVREDDAQFDWEVSVVDPKDGSVLWKGDPNTPT